MEAAPGGQTDLQMARRARFEVLPFAGIEEEAAKLPRPIRLAVTCSPVHGPDRGVEVATELCGSGHSVTVHVAARMVRDREHLDALLAGMADACVDDLFLIGGDAEQPLGDYASAVDLLPIIAEHPQRPATIGIAGYPEGHPRVADDDLEHALREKSRLADYVVTQMCFDAEALQRWIERHGELPVFVGMPGRVTRRKLLRMSARIGVGPSVDFLRKQRGLRRLLSPRSTVDRLYAEIERLDVAGFQFFTFNELADTWEWWEENGDAGTEPAGASGRLREHGRAAA
jgi:methylenetetrahydrofolate reductase (NADPH)